MTEYSLLFLFLFNFGEQKKREPLEVQWEKGGGGGFVEDGVVLLAKSGYSETGTYLQAVGVGVWRGLR